MDFVFDEWKKALGKLQDSVEKELNEVRKQKAEVMALRNEVFNRLSAGQYIRDDTRIVISAPEIIIGNVDKEGVLLPIGASRIIIRSNDTDIDCSGGSLTNRAQTIANIAVDPGPDGKENVVTARSVIINRAHDIVLDSNSDEGFFSHGYASAGGGIRLHSDRGITLDASMQNESYSKSLKEMKESLNKMKSDLKSQVSKQKSDMEKVMSDVEKLLSKQEGLDKDEATLRSDYDKIDSLNVQYQSISPLLYSQVTNYISLVAELAEVCRKLKCIDETDKKLSKAKSDYKTKSTGAYLRLTSENIDLISIDGDGNLRENETSGVSVRAANMKVTSCKVDGSVIDKSKVSVLTQNIDLSTANPKYKDAKNADIPVEGTFKLNSKDIAIRSVDDELKDGKIAEKKFPAEGSLLIRSAKMDLRSTDSEGKATGHVIVNAKRVEAKSMDVDKEKATDKQLAAGSTMVLVSEKMYEGMSDSKNKSKQVQISSEKVAIVAKTTAELQQDKATVQLDGGNLSIGGGKSAVFGETTVNGKTSFKADIQAPKAAIDNLEAKSSFKSTNISDGIAVPAPPSTASLSAKLKEEDAPKES